MIFILFTDICFVYFLRKCLIIKGTLSKHWLSDWRNESQSNVSFAWFVDLPNFSFPVSSQFTWNTCVPLKTFLLCLWLLHLLFSLPFTFSLSIPLSISLISIAPLAGLTMHWDLTKMLIPLGRFSWHHPMTPVPCQS